MLARRHPTQNLPSPPPTQQHQLTFDQLSQQLAAQELLNQYLESQQQSFTSPVVVDNALPAEFMTSAFDFANPTIRIQQSTPTPQVAAGFAQSSMLPTSAATASDMNAWNGYGSMQNNTQSLQTPRTSRTHQRASSSSSIGSNGSQYQAVTSATGYPYVAHSETSPSSSAVKVDSSYGADEPSRPFSNHLPTPTHTPTHDSFMNNNYNNNNFIPHTSSMDSTMAAHFSMKQTLMDQNVNDEEVPGFAHSARHSVSSYGPHSPATPHTSHGDDFSEDKFKMPPSGETSLSRVDSWLFNQFITYDDEPDLRQHTVPKFERTYTDAALDNFYDPTTMMVQPQSIPQAKPTSNASLLSPYRTSNPNDIVQRTLQAAQNARSQSPSSTVSRGVSPFRQNSPWRQPSLGYNSPNVRVGTAAQAREQKLEADAAYAMKQNATSSEAAEPKTISPKEVSLDYREADEDSKVPLFPESGASEYEHQYNGGNQYRNATQSNFDTTSGQSYRRDSWATPQYPSNFATTSAGTSQPNSTFAFVPPSISGNLHGLSYPATSQYRSNTSMPSASDPTPDFPAHLHSMESSA